jgi:geranylgeranyl diphosphate synthase type II
MTSGIHARRVARLRDRVDRYLSDAIGAGNPPELRDACTYVLAGGGKRLRAILLLLACEAVGGNARKALPAGAAVEIMHNFTLVHDDIMDHAPTRRGRPTVHLRWSLNTALLAGDVLLGEAYRVLLRTAEVDCPRIVGLFTTGVIEVCRGQALDLEFEGRDDVAVAEYFSMIERKTGRLISMATEMGGIIGGGTRAEIAALRGYGHELGRAFQLQDDLLDVIAEEKEFGKVIGGDIMEGKRTFLMLTALERSRGADRKFLTRILRKGGRGIGPRRAVLPAVTRLYEKYGVLEAARKEIGKNTDKAMRALRVLPANRARATLAWLADALDHRSS